MTAPSESRTQFTGTRLTRYLWLVWIVWLTFLAYPLGAFFGGHPTPLRIGIVLSAVALFVATYFWNVWFSAGACGTSQAGYPLCPDSARRGSCPVYFSLSLQASPGLTGGTGTSSLST